MTYKEYQIVLAILIKVSYLLSGMLLVIVVLGNRPSVTLEKWLRVYHPLCKVLGIAGLVLLIFLAVLVFIPIVP